MDQLYERDCTSKCRSVAHAKEIFSCIPLASSSQIRSYSVWVCHNFPLITDDIGRNILHVAAACGKWEIVEWLIKNCNVDVDIKDHESGWSALHRSFFYGQLFASRILCSFGASLQITDHEGFTPLDIILKDRLPYIEYMSSHPCDVYVWGSNFNYNLGLGNVQSRTVPEILEVFRKDDINIKQVAICKFHSAFLSTEGKVYTCGYGHGGRLGQGNEDMSLVPSLVKGMGMLNCIQIAAGQDHLLMLIEGGQVWSCGLNTYHQLGHIPPTEQSLIPKPIPLKFLKDKKIIGMRAARFHSVIYTKDFVYTFGLNAGQLGHPKGDRTQINPRQVSTLYNESWSITHVETSDGATVCATSRGDIFVLHEYQTRKIASRQLEISKLSVVGGNLDSRVDAAGIREESGLELRVMLLTKSGKIYLWRQTDPYLRRCLFNLQKELIISDIHINHSSVGLITTDNEGYIGKFAPVKSPRPAPTTHLHTALFNSKAMHGLNVLLDTDECNFINVKRLPHIYRGTSITSDSKGRNFAILQSSPKMGLVELPMVSESEMLQDFAKLYAEACIGEDFHDIIIKVGRREFAAHKYILAYRSDFFKKQFAANNFEINTLTIESVRPEAFEQVLKFIYTNHCDFLTHGYEVNWDLKPESGKKKKSSAKTSENANPVAILQNVSKSLGMNSLSKRLGHVKLINGHISLSESRPVEKITFDRNALSKLCDVNLLSTEGHIFHCHKCVLIARLDYFHSMLSTFWAESSHLENLPLPISSKVMEVIIDYMYTDKANKVLASEDPEFLCHVLLITDQLMITRLKEICEMSLTELITLKNAGELLELASVYNSQQLKKSCMQFICINLGAMIEAKALDVLSDNVIQDLSDYYRTLIPSMRERRMYFSSSPSHDTLDFIEKSYPIDCDSMFIRNRLDLCDAKTKAKHRSSFTRTELKDSPPVRSKSNSESSEKDIILDIIVPDINEMKITAEIMSSPEENNQKTAKLCNNAPEKKVNQRIMHCPSANHFPSLDKIMEEQQKLTLLHKRSSHHDMKPIPHLSQKQKKLIESNKDGKSKSNNIAIPTSPPAKSSCPWAKLPHQSPPSPSFWDAVAKKDFSPVSDSASDSKIINSPHGKHASQLASPAQQSAEDTVISLDEIQKAEEQKLRRAVNPKIKPLHILNIEDQAIEELLVMYNAKDNPKERIIISRVVPEEIASPVWKKYKC